MKTSVVYPPKDLASVEMSACLNMTYPSVPSLKTIGEPFVEKEGIVAILGSDGCEISKCSSLRRTLSADTSSKTWLAQHPLKRVASLHEFPILNSLNEDDCDGVENKGQDEIWNLIQEQEKKKKIENLGQFDIWTSIQSQTEDKQGDVSMKVEPYIHPLVKRERSLSLKSLEICTESLGSETGSDGFSSLPSKEDTSSDDSDHEDIRRQLHQEEKEELRFAKYNKKTSPKSFPPPLPSLVRGDGPSLRMQSHRKNGRFVLEAVSVPTQNYFNAQRQDGRLLLTFATNSSSSTENDPKKYEETCEEVLLSSVGILFQKSEEKEQDPNDENEVELDLEITINQPEAPKQSTQMLNNKLMMRIANKNPTSWSKRINQVINKLVKDHENELELKHQTPLSKSFHAPSRAVAMPPRFPQPPPSITSFAAAYNVYEACWRKKEASQIIFSLPPLQKSPPFKNNKFGFSNNHIINTSFKKGTEQQQQDQVQVLLREGGDTKGCKDPRRSLLFWEPHCIATS